MSTEEFDLIEPEPTAEDLLVLDDSRYVPGNVAVVTGTASGIGRATVVALAANGLSVVGADIDEKECAETADGMPSFQELMDRGKQRATEFRTDT